MSKCEVKKQAARVESGLMRLRTGLRPTASKKKTKDVTAAEKSGQHKLEKHKSHTPLRILPKNAKRSNTLVRQLGHADESLFTPRTR